MKKLLSILLVFSFFSYQSYHSLIYINYMLNKKYYAEVLCENKNNPEKPHCNGKCHLKKQLEQQKPVEDQHPFNKSSQVNFYPELLAVLLVEVEINLCQNFQDSAKSHFHFHLKNPFINKIFHPPRFQFAFYD